MADGDDEGHHCRSSSCHSEKNALQLKVGRLKRELKEISSLLEAAKKGQGQG